MQSGCAAEFEPCSFRSSAVDAGLRDRQIYQHHHVSANESIIEGYCRRGSDHYCQLVIQLFPGSWVVFSDVQACGNRISGVTAVALYSTSSSLVDDGCVPGSVCPTTLAAYNRAVLTMSEERAMFVFGKVFLEDLTAGILWSADDGDGWVRR